MLQYSSKKALSSTTGTPNILGTGGTNSTSELEEEKKSKAIALAKSQVEKCLQEFEKYVLFKPTV